METGPSDARTGPLLVARAAAVANQGALDDARRWLTEAKETLSPDAFRGLLQDPIFKPYRASEELKQFWEAAP